MVYEYYGSGSYGGGLSSVIYNLQYWGLSDVFLPFLLIFTLVFAILQKVNIFGRKDESADSLKRTKGFNVVIAMVMGLAVVIPHVMGMYPPNADIVNIINSALPQVSIVLVAVLMALLIIGLFGGKTAWGGEKIGGWVAIGCFVLIVYIFGRSAGWFEYLPSWLYWLDNPDTQAMLLVVGVFAILIWFITKEEKKPEDRGKTVKDLHKFFGG